ncbi:MAG: hypothetical protein Q9174_004113 [Haloplaca sp. 1 TL-2023]
MSSQESSLKPHPSLPRRPSPRRDQTPGAVPSAASTVRLKFGRLAYRDAETNEPWVDVRDSYQSMATKADMDDPWNVEQVHFRQGSIEVSQLHAEWSGKRQELHHGALPRYQWIATFKELYNVVVSEQIVEKSIPDRSDPSICRVRFRCKAVKGDEYCSCPEDEGSTAETKGEDREEGSEDGEIKETHATEERKGVDKANEHEQAGDEQAGAMDVDPKESQVSNIPKPSEYPLAALSSSFEGKEFQLSIYKTRDLKVKTSSKYSFVWPGAIRFLANMKFTPSKNSLLNERLDIWAMKNQDSLQSVRLIGLRSDTGNGLVCYEWALQPIARGPQQSTVEAGSTTLAASQPSLPSAPPTMSGSKRKYDDMPQSKGDILAAIEEASHLFREADGRYQQAKAQKKEAQTHREALFEQLTRLNVEEEQGKKQRQQ